MSLRTQMRGAVGRLYDGFPLRRPLAHALRPFGLPQRLYQHLHFQGPFTLPTPGRSLRLMHYGHEIENELFWEGLPGQRERVSMEIWMSLAATAEVVMDIGANTGIYALVAKALRPEAQVFAFEPVTRICEKLALNCRLSGMDVQVEPLALSNLDGTATLYDHEAEHHSIATLDPHIYGTESRRRVSVAVRRLSSFIEERRLRRLDLVKVDVEAHEPEVLEGMGPYLRTFRPSFLIEILTDAIGQRVQESLAGLDYLFFDLDDRARPRRVERLTKSAHWNYLICSPAVAGRLGLTDARH